MTIATRAIEAFARHRELGIEQGKAIGRREALEEAAKVADDLGADRPRNADNMDFSAQHTRARTIAAAIRALIGETK